LTIPSAYNSLPDTFSEGENGLSLRSDQEAYKLPLEELAVIIANTGSNSITLGEQRMLEKLQEGVWYKVPYRDEFAFTDIGLGLGAEEKLEQKIPLEYLDYRLT
ncbi:immunoglobulin-like domain-containing protein, partial [Halomonas sp. SIMBA_159]